jgi:hypothetical protein
MSEKAEARLSELRSMSDEFAKAYADRAYLEEFRKSKLAMLMKDAEVAGFSSAAAQEREARASKEYVELLENLRTATEQSERLRWHLEVAKLGVAVWQTQQANERAERKAYGA